MTRSRIYGMLAGYADQNDHDELRFDPLFKLIVGRKPSDDALASQPTLSRFENAISVPSLWRLQDVLVDQFLDAFDEPPKRLTFDIDPFDDPTHGHQQLTFFHGYYGQYQYLPRAITCAQIDLTVMVCLLHGTACPTLGADDDIEYLVRRLRAKWPDVVIEFRGDSGFGAPVMFDVCEGLGLFYSFGLRMNSVLKGQSEALLAEAVQQYEKTSQPQRLFTAFLYQAKSWPAPRWVVVKAEANAEGTNRRAVVSNRPGAELLPQATYDEYAEHVEAMNILVRLRRLVADPPPEKATAELPQEALAGRDRQRFFNQRRGRDPLGEGHACTWRMRLIKVAARVTETTRRIVVHLSNSWPFLDHYHRVSAQVLGLKRENLSSA